MSHSLLMNFKAPLPEALRLKYDFFELYAFDGGGSFIQREILGSIADDAITAAILDHHALADFGTLPELDFHKFERWATIEKGCWINRLYFLVPLARIAKLRGDARIAGLVRDVINFFFHSCPPPATAAAVRELEAYVSLCRDRDYNEKTDPGNDPIPYQWYDFQPASRLVNGINAMVLLRDFACISAADRELFDEFVRRHARVIYAGEVGSEPSRGNHQALRALGLLYAAAYCHGEPEAATWQAEGVRLANYHILNDYLADGLLHEISPSYHFFETWISRDAVLLARQYRFALAPEAEAMTGRAFAIARELCAPDGWSIVINDGYALKLQAFLESYPVAAAPGGEFHSAPGGLAGWREGGDMVFLDASPMPMRFSHYHCGKNAVNLWKAGLAFLDDSGCCNYDAPDFHTHFKSSDAHSSLLLDGHGDGELQGRYDCRKFATCELGEWHAAPGGGRAIASTLTSTADHWESVRWRRELQIGDSRLTILDTVSSPGAQTAEFIFVLHPEVTVELACERLTLRRGAVALELSWRCRGPVTWSVVPHYVFRDFARQSALKLVARTAAAACELTTFWQ